MLPKAVDANDGVRVCVNLRGLLKLLNQQMYSDTIWKIFADANVLTCPVLDKKINTTLLSVRSI